MRQYVTNWRTTLSFLSLFINVLSSISEKLIYLKRSQDWRGTAVHCCFKKQKSVHWVSSNKRFPAFTI
jgi:hypothetical protein